MLENNQALRSTHLVEDIAVIDGQPGCGKTLFNTLCNYLERFEMHQYTPTIENIFALHDLDKLSLDACQTMLEIEIDLMIYESMMSRNANFRFKDLSSVVRNRQLSKYIKRLFLRGDEYIPDRIKQESPVLHLCTHNLLSYSKPFFKSYPEKLKFLEIVRHPLYQVIQMSLNYETLEKTDNSRFFYINLYKDEEHIPFWADDWEEYKSLSYVDKAIHEMFHMSKRTEKFKEANRFNNLLTISFEKFVIDPFEDIEKLKSFFNSDFKIPQSKALKLQNVPRIKVADGISNAIYERCGWEPGEDGLTETEELEKRREFVIRQGASEKSVSMLDDLTITYNNKYGV